MKNMKHLKFGDVFYMPSQGRYKEEYATVAKVGRTYITTSHGDRFVIETAREESYPYRRVFESVESHMSYVWKKSKILQLSIIAGNIDPMPVSESDIDSATNLLVSMRDAK